MISDIKDKQKINIAFWGAHFSWDGGIDLLVYLLNGLNSVKEKYHLSIYFVLPNDTISELKYFILDTKSSLKKGRLPLFKKKRINDRIRSAIHNLDPEIQFIYYNYTQSDLINKLNSINCSVLLPVVNILPNNFPFPWIGYIPDLQHISLPHFFSFKEKESRDRRYFALLKNAPSIIVNAKSVKEELEITYGNSENVFNLSFLPPFIPTDFSEKELINKKYKIENSYFIICNQFWKHKDHLIAFKAFSMLIKDPGFKEIKLVCTGRMEDERFPEYIDELQKFIITEKLQNSILLLGFIPKIDQMILMDESIALIQPTLFEGGPGGGAVYSAVSLGIRSIISDIEVNKEIKNELVSFFEASNETSLYIKMKEILNSHFQKLNLFELENAGIKRTKELGEEFMAIINTTILRYKK